MVRDFPELRGDAGKCRAAYLAPFLTLAQEEMAAASLDVNFKEELSAIEQCE